MDGLLDPRSDLGVSSEDQSTQAARGRGFHHRLIPVCATCLGLLDAVVAEWSSTPSDGNERCSTCGRPATALVETSPRQPRDVTVDVDAVGRAVAVRVSGGLSEQGLEIVALEIAANAALGAPVIANLRDAVLLRPVTIGLFIREVRRVMTGTAPVGLVIQSSRLSQFASDLARRAGWVSGETEGTVRAMLAPRSARLRQGESRVIVQPPSPTS